ncbi:MAG: TRAP transporter substrate-binding protein [Desulfobacterales bacterium]|jgi:C4-dicarboxylate-binding protein DctP
MKKRNLSLILMLIVLLLPSLLFAAQKEAVKYKWVYAGYPSPKISSGMGVVYFAKEVEKRTNGRVKFELHHRGSLYNEEKAVEALLAGAIDFALAGTSTIGVFTRRYDWVNLPFVASHDIKKGPTQLRHMMYSPVGREIQANVEKEIGIKALFIMSSNGGPRAIATRKKRLVTPADIENVKVRVSLAPLDVIINKAWGANPIPVPWADTLPSMNQGMFEAVQIPLPHIHDVGFDEICKYITMVNFQYLPQVMWVTTKFWNSLPSDIKDVLTQVGQEASLYEHKVDLEKHEYFRQKIKERGTEIIDLTPEQMKLWSEGSASVYDNKEVAKHTPPELIKRLFSERAKVK